MIFQWVLTAFSRILTGTLRCGPGRFALHVAVFKTLRFPLSVFTKGVWPFETAR